MSNLPEQSFLEQLGSQGFSADATAIIGLRHEHLVAQAIRWAEDDDRWQQIFSKDNLGLRQELAQSIQQAIRTDPSVVWKDRISALAQDWGVFSDVVSSSLAHCIGNGWLDMPVSGQRQRQRPKSDEILEQFRALLQAHGSVENRAKALVKERLCRDINVARLVARQFMGLHIQRKAINRTYAIISAWGIYDDVGLLNLSSFPFYEELRLLETYIQAIPLDQRPPDEVIAVVRADVIGVCVGLSTLNSKLCKVYHAYLWTEPPKSSNRIDYVERFLPRLRSLAFTAIGAARGCELAEAEILFDRYTQGGISAILDGRWPKLDGDEQQTVETIRFMEAVRAVTIGIEPTIRAEIERLSEALLRSLDNVDIPYSRIALITDSPSSGRRRGWGRRLTFGVPAIVKRRHQRSREKLNPCARLKRFRERQVPQSLGEDDLIAEFTRQSLLTPTDAANRLRNTLTYGVFGLAPRSHWYKLFDKRLIAWLKLIKFGHPARSIEWSQVYQGAAVCACEIGIALPSSQVLRAVYNSLDKPRHWHGGKGLLMIRVHQRAPRVITGLPELHASWFMVWITISLGLSGENGSAGGPASHLLLVFDEETELLMGGWLSQHAPGSREVALAFYQSIWHPGISDYPLRGIPKVLRIPKALLKNGDEQIRRAASYLLSDIQVTEKSSLQGKKRAQKLIAEIQKQGVVEVQRTVGDTQIGSGQALRLMLDWIKKQTFPHHRQREAPLEIRKDLVAMPGHDTPAAGWLLPVVGKAEAIDCGILFQGELYASPTFRAEPGQELPVRAFPFFYPTEELFNVETGIFVEVSNGASSTLEYLTR